MGSALRGIQETKREGRSASLCGSLPPYSELHREWRKSGSKLLLGAWKVNDFLRDSHYRPSRWVAIFVYPFSAAQISSAAAATWSTSGTAKPFLVRSTARM